MKRLLIVAGMALSLSAQADGIASRLFQATTEQAKDYAIERSAGSAFDAAKGAAEKAVYAETLKGTAVSVLDGDTIDLKTADNKVTRIRFDSIDAPEKTQPYGQVAKKTLTSWIATMPVTVNVTGKDRYGRMIGVVFLEGVNINKAMVEKGLAFANTQYLNDKSIQRVEDKAKAGRVGIWQLPESQIVKPWDFRHAQK
jgi:endonuclease YncB( thermonuclease family)